MFCRPNGKSRPSSDGGHGHRRKRRSQKEAVEVSGASCAPIPVESPKKSSTPLFVPEKRAHPRELRERNASVAAADEQQKRTSDELRGLAVAVAAFGRKADEQHERIREDVKLLVSERPQRTSDELKGLEARVREELRAVAGELEQLRLAVAGLAVAKDDLGKADEPQSTTKQRKWEAGGVLGERKVALTGMTAVSDVRGRAEVPLKGTVKKKKLETPVVPVVVSDSHEGEKVYPSEETKGGVRPVEEASADQVVHVGVKLFRELGERAKRLEAEVQVYREAVIM